MECQFITHLDVGTSRVKEQFPKESKPLLINSDVYIGADVTILPGIEIGEASVIAAKSLVTKNVLPDFVYGGIPARKIRPTIV
jgi:maltose O-acetyltransferase